MKTRACAIRSRVIFDRSRTLVFGQESVKSIYLPDDCGDMFNPTAYEAVEAAKGRLKADERSQS